MYDHHLHSKWSQLLFRVKVINNESLYIEGSRRVDGKPTDVIHLQARASSHKTKSVCYRRVSWNHLLSAPCLQGQRCNLLTKKQWSFASKQHSLGMQSTRTRGKHRTDSELSFTCSVLWLLLQWNSNIVLLFLIKSSSLCLLILCVQFETWELFCCEGGDSEIPILLLNKNVMFRIM